MTDQQQAIIRCYTGASGVGQGEPIQSLWSGYGSIVRYPLVGADRPSVVVKHVQADNQPGHPRGWNTDISHQRKMRSYQIETTWYERYASQCDDSCRVAECLAVESRGSEVFMVFEDLDASGFAGRRSQPRSRDIRLCIRWLANFHATFLGESSDGLWEQGCYWHLATRPDELASLSDPALKEAAPAIDQTLRNCRFRSFCHGDAKIANFCFSDGDVAAVDFQYVGGGCGMKDLAYFISSCLYEDECERQEDALLATYFGELRVALERRRSNIDFAALEAEWRALYPMAWTDFFRFLQGWSPGHWKIHSYSQRLAREVLAAL